MWNKTPLYYIRNWTPIIAATFSVFKFYFKTLCYQQTLILKAWYYLYRLLKVCDLECILTDLYRNLFLNKRNTTQTHVLTLTHAFFHELWIMTMCSLQVIRTQAVGVKTLAQWQHLFLIHKAGMLQNMDVGDCDVAGKAATGSARIL